KAISTEEFFPITLKEQTPGLSYDDSLRVQSIPRSQTTSKTSWEGTGINPEGPAGGEGQTAPAFRDMSNIVGKVSQETQTVNEELNKRSVQEERSPTIDRVTVSVNIDGTWKLKYDEKRKPVLLPDGSIEREYTSIPPEELRATQQWIQNAIGYNAARGDSVTVQNIRFDRTQEHADKDAQYFKTQQVQNLFFWGIGGLVFLIVAFFLFRAISREMERRRRAAEDERSRREQALRESALMQAEEDQEVPISVEERERMNLHEGIIKLTKEHPEDVAQLIRTWLLEE
ncbi:MAG: flagellar M-ring protein FliF, partial [Treponema sp.]|nr:flagellar M-ring protein FliF [Treponema sp.]